MQKKVLLIDDIIDTTETQVKVRLTATGKCCTLRRELAEFYPGRVVIPAWLADKILKNYEEKR